MVTRASKKQVQPKAQRAMAPYRVVFGKPGTEDAHEAVMLHFFGLFIL